MNSTPKIGVLTFHRCINYGSYWQARCLVDGLRAYGLHAVLLDHHSARVNRAEWRCAFRPQLPAPSVPGDYPLYRQKIESFLCAFAALPLSAPFDLDKPQEMEEFDTVVVGSDEVWNLWHPWYGHCPLFYGVGVRAKRLIAYAASFGNHISQGSLDSYWAEQLRRFNSISVRDDNSRQIIHATLGTEAEIVLDPCLQFDLQPEGLWRGPNEKFVAVYGHNFSPWFSDKVRQWAHSHGLKLVSIGYRNDWADNQWIEAGPHDFAHFMSHAEAVVTNFFHGCVFALRNAKPFVCETSDYRFVKVRNLMQTVGGEHHLVNPNTNQEQYDALLDEALDDEIAERLSQLRERSSCYLERSLC